MSKVITFLKKKTPYEIKYNHYLHYFIFFINNIKNLLQRTRFRRSLYLKRASFALEDCNKLKENKSGNLDITLVEWVTNRSSLRIKSILPSYKLLAKEENKVYFSISKNLYFTTDSFHTMKFITRLPVIPSNGQIMLVSPIGYFIEGEYKIIYSKDLHKWDIIHQVNNHGLKHSFDYYYDVTEKKCFVYFAEYSCNSNARHKVHKGIIDTQGYNRWSEVLDFYSLTEYDNDKSIASLSARHVHTVVVDKDDGTVWVGVGDEDIHSKILFSQNNGKTFKILGQGTQEWRTLSIWLTPKYVYWNMDSHEPQKVFRVGKQYLKQNIEQLATFGVNNLKNKYNIEKETIAKLSNGAFFYNCEIFNNYNEQMILMSACAEGTIKDRNGRVFGIVENLDGSVNIQEIIAVSPKNKKDVFTQLVPELQDSFGYIYFSTRNLIIDGIIKTKLMWND